MSFQEREKEGPFSPQRYTDVQATRHATAGSRRVRGPGKDIGPRQPPRATEPLITAATTASRREPPTLLLLTLRMERLAKRKRNHPLIERPRRISNPPQI